MSVALYRLLLLLLPAGFRREYGEVMLADFHSMLGDRTSPLPSIWLLAAADLIKTADREWRHEMRTRSTYRSLLIVVLAMALLLLVPAIAMQFTTEVDWSPFDFVVAGLLLSGTGFLFVIVAVFRFSDTGFRDGAVGGWARLLVYRLGVAVALGATLFLAWVILAVGVIGDAGDRPDLMYLAVLAVGVVGAALARLHSPGMARAMVGMAVAQALVAAVALLGRMAPAYNTAYEVIGVNAIFVALFLAAAWLFHAAARKSAPARAAQRG